MRLSCALATSMDTPEHVRVAESLGYERAWLYDSPALYPDVWVQLCRAAERTSTIGLGPGVLVPSLRHPLVTASAIATLVGIAGPERVAIAVGTGFTGRFAMGKRPLAWATVAEYVRTVRALLRGDTVSWDGGRIRMLHPDGFGPARPIEVPFLLGAAGPKGIATAAEVGDGLFVGGGAPVPGFEWEALLFMGTVLLEGDDASSARAMEAAGHAAPVLLHFVVEHGMPHELVPGLDEWLEAYADVPDDERHLAMHDLHLVAINERDRPFVTPEVLTARGLVYTPSELRDRVAAAEAAGATEIAYQPAGDVPAELEAFAAAFHG